MIGSRSRPPRRHAVARCLLLLATLLMLVAGYPHHLTLAQEATPGHGIRLTPEAGLAPELESWITAAIRPELQDDVVAAMPADLPTYELSAALDPGQGNDARLTGSLQLRYLNTTGAPLDALPFRLYANGPDAEHDAVTVDAVTVDGEPVDASLSVDDSVLVVPLEQDLAPGDTVTIAMDFTTTPPLGTTTHYGIFNIDANTGTWALAHWYPVLAGRDPVRGWVLDPPSHNGDPIFSDTALYDVTIAAPDDWVVVTSGVDVEAARASGDDGPRRFVTGPVRDFAFVADADFELLTQEVDGVTINSWFNPGEEAIGEAAATYGAQAIELFDEVLGAYPYTSLDLVPVEMYGAAGCEFPQLIYIGHDYYVEPEVADVPSALDFTVAHEVVHQWFYGLVGNNQYADAFIDEGLTQYLSSEVYFRLTYNRDVADEVTETFLERPFARFVEAGDDQVVHQPTDDFETGRAYSWAAYVKAPLGFAAIHEAIGDEAFFGGLQEYVREFTFGVATPDDLLTAFEDASGQELDAIWRHWFEETSGEDDI